MKKQTSMRSIARIHELASFAPEDICAWQERVSGSARREDLMTPADWDAFARPCTDQIRGALLGSLLWMVLVLMGLTLRTLSS